jgi:hypothetical protein
MAILQMMVSDARGARRMPYRMKVFAAVSIA